MFSYYGSKSKIIDYYPHPKHAKVIEPFAGSARYALKFWQKEVLIVDSHEPIIKLWRWLQQCSPNDILGLPKFELGMKLDNLCLSEGERLLLGFFASPGSVSARNAVTVRGKECFDGSPNRYKTIANNLHKIKHWEIRLGCYSEIKNEIATWFIDAPYQFGGEHYAQSSRSIDFSELAAWSKSRIGQVIVCENTRANWLPFRPICKIQGSRNTNTIDAIWSNEMTKYDYQQQTLQF